MFSNYITFTRLMLVLISAMILSVEAVQNKPDGAMITEREWSTTIVAD